MKSTTEIKIRNYHIDHFDHVNHARYEELLEEARWQYLESNHLLESLNRLDTHHVVTKIVIQYLHAVKIGDVLRIESNIDGRSDCRFWFDQKAYIGKSGKCAIKATVTNVLVNQHGRPRAIDGDVLRIWTDLCNTALYGKNGCSDDDGISDGQLRR